MSIILKSGSSGNLANIDALGNLYVLATPAAIPNSLTPGWDSATVLNTEQVLLSEGGFASILVQFDQGSTLTAGAVTYEGTYDGSNWVSLPAGQVVDPVTYAPAANPYTFAPSTNYPVLLSVGGFQQIRLRLSTAIMGTGYVAIYWTLLSNNPQVETGIVTVGNFPAAFEIWDGATVLFTSGNPGYVQGSVTASIAAAQTIAVTNAGIFAVQDSAAEGHLSTLAGTVAGGAVTVAGTVAVTGAIAATQGTSPWVVSNSGIFAVQDSTAEGYLATLAGAISGSAITVSGTVAVTQSTSPWVVSNSGVFAVQEATLDACIASNQVAVSAASGAFASGSVSDGAVVTLGSKADARDAHTDSTPITAMQVLKEISYMAQNPAVVAVTNAGTFAVQDQHVSAITAGYQIITDGTNALFTSSFPGYIQGSVGISAGQTIAVTNVGIFAVQDSVAEGYLSTLAGTVSAGAVTVAGTVTTSPPSDATTNVTEVGGSALALGATVMADSLPVAFATDQTALGVTGSVTATGTLTANIGTTGGLALDATVSGLRTSVNDPNNTTIVTLGANGVFTGASTDVSAYESVQVSVFTDQASATNGLQLQFSADNSNWDFKAATSISASAGVTVPSGKRERYFRVVYTNGATPQGVFRLYTLLTPTAVEATKRFLSQPPTNSQLALLTNSVLSGMIVGSTKYVNVATDIYGSLQTVFGGQSADAFGRARTAQPAALFGAQFQYDTQPLLFQTSVSGTGTVAKTTNESSLTLSTGGTLLGASAINQTKQYFRYEPGRSQQIMMTGIIGAQKANVRSRIGYFDANDGVFFEMDGSNGMSVVQRSSTSGSPVDTHVAQSAWNTDPMDGTGPSGVTLNFANGQIFVIDLQWLGVGRVRYGFSVNGQLVVCHTIYNANIVNLPYMNTANLPCRAEIVNTGVVASSTSMTQICMTVISEGGDTNPSAYTFAASNGANFVSGIGSTRTALVSIRPKTTFNSITNRSKITVTDFDVLDNSAPAAFWELVYNGTLGGSPSFNSVDNNSGVNFDVAGTTCTGGTVLASGYIPGGGKTTSTIALNIEIPFTLDFAGSTPDTITLCVSSTSTNIAASGALRWTEVR